MSYEGFSFTVVRKCFGGCIEKPRKESIAKRIRGFANEFIDFFSAIYEIVLVACFTYTIFVYCFTWFKSKGKFCKFLKIFAVFIYFLGVRCASNDCIKCLSFVLKFSVRWTKKVQSFCKLILRFFDFFSATNEIALVAFMKKYCFGSSRCLFHLHNFHESFLVPEGVSRGCESFIIFRCTGVYQLIAKNVQSFCKLTFNCSGCV